MARLKIKYSLGSINIKTLQKLFLILTAFTIVFRTIQRLFFIDFETGFYKSNANLSLGFSFFLIAVCAIFIVLSFLSSDTKGLSLHCVNSKPLFLCCIIMAVFMGADAISALVSFFESMAEESGQVTNGVLVSFASNEAICFLRTLFAVLSLIYFARLALKVNSDTKTDSKFTVIPLFSILWAATKLFPLFKTQISYVRVSDLFMEIVLYVFAVMFFYALMLNVSLIGYKGNCWKISAYGFSLAFLSFSISIPKLICVVVDKSKYINSDYPLSLTSFFIGVFALVLVLSASESERIDEEIPKDEKDDNDKKSKFKIKF